MQTDALTYYTRQSTITDPGAEAEWLAALPRDLPTLHDVTQNLMIHAWKVRKYHPEWLPGRTNEYELRAVADLLAHARTHNDAPVTEARPKEQRLIVDCRHFAVLLCTLLRAQGVPARVRVGFATYLEPSHFQDHWVTEYWNGDRWVMEDPDLKKHDVAADEFYTGGRAWQLVRSGEMAEDRFGYDPEWRGLWVVRHDVIRDLAALNGVEMLSGDEWGLIELDEREVTDGDRAFIDKAAALTLVENDRFEEMRRFYEKSPDLRLPPVISCHNYLEHKHKTVDVSKLRR